MTLTGKQRRFLRGRGHHLSAIAQIGKEGLSPSFVLGVDQALEDHELIKVRLGQNALLDRHDAAASLADQTSSEVAQVIGGTILLFRAHPDKPRIKLPT